MHIYTYLHYIYICDSSFYTCISHIYIYIYMYMCIYICRCVYVCWCVCACV